MKISDPYSSSPKDVLLQESSTPKGRVLLPSLEALHSLVRETKHSYTRVSVTLSGDSISTWCWGKPWLTLTHLWVPHFKFIIQPNPIFSLQIWFTSIAPSISGYYCWLPDLNEINFFLKDYCQHIQANCNFSSLHVLNGGVHTATKMYLSSDIFPPYLLHCGEQDKHQKPEKKLRKERPLHPRPVT